MSPFPGQPAAWGRPWHALFFEAGASLAVAGRNAESLDGLLDALRVPAARRLATAVDLTDAAAAKGWAAKVAAAFGRVDVVLHLVGGYRGGAAIADIVPSRLGLPS